MIDWLSLKLFDDACLQYRGCTTPNGFGRWLWMVTGQEIGKQQSCRIRQERLGNTTKYKEIRMGTSQNTNLERTATLICSDPLITTKYKEIRTGYFPKHKSRENRYTNLLGSSWIPVTFSWMPMTSRVSYFQNYNYEELNLERNWNYCTLFGVESSAWRMNMSLDPTTCFLVQKTTSKS
jgi:hypothetical protein